MSLDDFGTDVPPPGTELDVPISSVFGLKGRYGSQQLQDDLEKIREAEQQADLVIASISVR